MKRKYNESALQAAQRHIIECRQAASLFPALCRVFRAFDGKVYNKRLDSAIQAEAGRVYIQKRDQYIDIYTYSEGGDHFTLLYFKLPENKRIKAANFIQAAESKRNEYLQEAFHLEQIIPTIDTRKKQIEHIKHLLEMTLQDLSYSEQELFELNYHIRRHY
jgi:hypothetical protein